MNSKIGSQVTSNKISLTSLSKEFINFSIYSNLYVAFITTFAAFYYQSQLQVFSLQYLGFLFCATLFIYNLDRSRIKKRDLINKRQRCQWLQSHKRTTLVLTSLAFISYSTLFLMSLNQTRSYATLSILLLCLLYCSDKVLKIPALKNILLATIWATACVSMPYFWDGKSISSDIVSPYIIYFLSALINSAICDQEDRRGDKKNKIKTLALILSKKSQQNLIYLLCIVLFIMARQSEIRGFMLTAVAFACLNYRKEGPFKSFLSDGCLCLPLLFLCP
jgi:4-hydroxybenzoate polyprenyltransferase